jgi:hypothetical protein
VKTIVIWDACDANLKFFVVDRDVTHLNHHYVNSTETSDETAHEISNLVYDGDGNRVIDFLDEFPLDVTDDSDFAVISCGFLP